MKRVISLLLLFAMLMSVGCVNNTDKPAETKAPDSTNTEAPETTKAPSADEYTLPREDGKNQISFYWYNETGNYDKCDMWIWFPNGDGRGYEFHPCEYGAKVVLNVPQDVEEVGFIVRRDCSDPGGTSWGDATKDYDGDRYAKIEGETTEVFLKPGDGAMYKSNDGGKTLYQDKQFDLAGIVALNQIKYRITPAFKITSLDQIKVTEEGREIAVTELSSLNNEVVTGVITLAEELDISKNYTVTIEGYESKVAVPTEVFDSAEFIEKYAYDGPLGAQVDADGTMFRVWAPTASAVKLNLYLEGDGGEVKDSYDMEKGDKGVWSFHAWSSYGMYYTYTVTTAIGTYEVVDPYAKAVGVNGDRGMVVDLDGTDPEGWQDDNYYQDINAYNEAVIWEVHVRDFSNRIEGSKYKGKYLAFTEKGLKNASGEAVGIDYLVDLGVTHVHLQPVYDYATVNEASDAPQFNWGYDPKNYNAPEGSYSTDPYHGEVRVNEFKQMVQALHEAGMGVIMDVVYNHTYSADSNFNRIVPYYYYRYTAGELSNGSGCGNETASDRIMFRKFMVDSVTYWATEYHIDGFRFDLMALHDVDTMQAVEEAVHADNPKAIIYGEGWTGGTSALRDNLQANQKNIGKIQAHGIGAVAVFDDAIRDGLKGSVFDAKDKGYINGNATKGTAEKVFHGISGGQTNVAGWTVPDNAVICYMACHDNNTIWDKLEISNADASVEDRLLMNRLGASIIMLSKGVPFFLAGEEMLRTKDGDHNSYASSDAVNNIDWDALTQGSDVMMMRDFYRALIRMRRANSFFTTADVSCELLDGNAIKVTWSVNGETVAMALINPDAAAASYDVEGEWRVLLSGWNAFTSADISPNGIVSGTVTIEGRSVLIVVG